MCKRVEELHHKIKIKKQMDSKGNYIYIFINNQTNRIITRYCSHNKWLKITLTSVCENKKQQNPHKMERNYFNRFVDSLELITLKRYLPISSNTTNICAQGDTYRKVYCNPKLEITLYHEFILLHYGFLMFSTRIPCKWYMLGILYQCSLLLKRIDSGKANQMWGSFLVTS